MLIAVDFDGTLAVHKFPGIGEPVPLAIETCLALQADGHKLLLYTMRCGEVLQQAVDWCAEHGLVFTDVNKSPGQFKWSKSPKVYAELYIDDVAYGTPLIHIKDEKPMVDWTNILEYVRSLK